MIDLPSYNTAAEISVTDHPFMTSTQTGEAEGFSQKWTGGGGGVKAIMTSRINKKPS